LRIPIFKIFEEIKKKNVNINSSNYSRFKSSELSYLRSFIAYAIYVAPSTPIEFYLFEIKNTR
jgi:hypothetical protein